MKYYKIFTEGFLTDDRFIYKVGGTYEISENEKKNLLENGIVIYSDISELIKYDEDNFGRIIEVIPNIIREQIYKDEVVGYVTDKLVVVRELVEWEMVELSNTGNKNSGLGNYGNRNTGWYNFGDKNSGNNNVGHLNSGRFNFGRTNSGECNIGDCNAGFRNIGDSNTGYNNIGNSNTGHNNEGDFNSGYYNKTNYSAGVLCDEEPTVKLFNKDTNLKMSEFKKLEVFGILRYLFDAPILEYYLGEETKVKERNGILEELKPNFESEVTKFAIQKTDLKTRREKKWRDLTKKKKQLIFELPNFDKKVFENILGFEI